MSTPFKPPRVSPHEGRRLTQLAIEAARYDIRRGGKLLGTVKFPQRRRR